MFYNGLTGFIEQWSFAGTSISSLKICDEEQSLLQENIRDAQYDIIETQSSMAPPIPAGNKMERFLLVDNLNAQDSSGMTRLMDAVVSGDTEEVKLLISLGANKELKNTRDMTALMIAVMYRNIDIMKILLQNGAEKEQKNVRGMTPLMLAVMYCPIDIVLILLEYRPKLDAHNLMGMTALMIATALGKSDVMRLLINVGASTNAKNGEEMTALMIAAALGRATELKILIDAGANTENKDTEGSTALMYAVRSAEPKMLNKYSKEYLYLEPQSRPYRVDVQNKMAITILVMAGASTSVYDIKRMNALDYANIIDDKNSGSSLKQLIKYSEQQARINKNAFFSLAGTDAYSNGLSSPGIGGFRP